jgi:hypothetical protein
MLRTPHSASEQAVQLAKRNHSSIMTNTLISFLMEIFRRLSARFTPFYTPNAAHATFGIGTSPAARKTQSFVDFDENSNFVADGDKSTFKRSFHSILHAIAVRATFSIGASPATRNTQTFLDYDENCVITYLIEIFRRLNASFIPFCAPNALHATFSIGIISAARKTQSFVDYDENSNFDPDGDIATFKRCFHSIFHAERSACHIQHRNKPCISENTIIRGIFRKL